ncbi:PIN domain-containing protein [Actinomyces viscosus]|uniref:PIN domain-containing protein n=1 Tax=Actinomyces viscosus TaxID=1656 RepID=UPI0028EFFF9C|nr:PIN domain-containing protein [Actinomyces viscosus]
MKTQRVFVDANILFSKTLMDWLFLLRRDNSGMFQLISTHDVFSEVLYNMRKENPGAPGWLISRRYHIMKDNMDDIVEDFPSGLDFSGTDERDYHVHAAATSRGADFILTQNKLSDFTSDPDNEVYEIITPDDFYTLVADSNPSCLLPIVKEQLTYWRTKPNQRQLDDALLHAGCATFSGRINKVLRQLAMLP